MPDQFPEVMDAKQCADFLQITLPTLHKLIKNKEIPCTKIGGQWRFSKRQIIDYIEEQAQNHAGFEVSDFENEIDCEKDGSHEWRALDRRKKNERAAYEKGAREVCIKCNDLR